MPVRYLILILSIWSIFLLQSIAAITELSQFYKKAGPRAGLTVEVGQAVRIHLDVAEKSLSAVQQESNTRNGEAAAFGSKAGSNDDSMLQGLFLSTTGK